jgi:hypothetical protein
MNERQLQDAFEAWLRKMDIPFLRSRMDKATTIREGWPDFSVFWMSHCLFIECKVDKGKLSDVQERVIASIRRAGNKVLVARSLEDCIEGTKNILCIGHIAAAAKNGNVPPPKRPRKVAKEPAPPAVPSGTADSEKLFIAKVAGKDCVCRGSGQAGSEFEIVRKATPADIINIR